MEIIYLSDGYKGGNSTFIEQNINYNLKNKKKIILIDKRPNSTFPQLKKHKNLRIIKLDVIKDKIRVKKFITKLGNKNYLFFFTNFAILIHYFIYFFSQKKNYKLAMALHSGVFNYKLKTFIGLFVFSFFSLCLDYLIYGSFSSKKWWLRFFPWMRLIKYKVILNGIDLNKKKNKKKKITNISFIGRLEKENDPNLFLDICSLNKKNKKLRFNIFGDGSLKNAINKRIDNVKIWGWTDKKTIYANTDITIITSPINNFPYVALESNSYGIPVITASQGDVRRIIKNNLNGYIFDLRTKESYNKHLMNTLINYERLSKNSFINAKKFSSKKSCQQICSFLKITNKSAI